MAGEIGEMARVAHSQFLHNSERIRSKPELVYPGEVGAGLRVRAGRAAFEGCGFVMQSAWSRCKSFVFEKTRKLELVSPLF
jgi:hypothetical protein